MANNMLPLLCSNLRKDEATHPQHNSGKNIISIKTKHKRKKDRRSGYANQVRKWQGCSLTQSDYLQRNLCQLYNFLRVWMCMDMNIFHTSGLFLVFKEWRLYHSHLFCLLLLCTKTVCSLSLPFFCLWELLWASLGLNIFLLTCVCVCIVWNTCLPAVFPPSLHIKSRHTHA